jgi:TorA maturation chaperone TorD
MATESAAHLMGVLPEVFSLLSEVFMEPEADVKVRLRALLQRCPERCPGLEGLPEALQGMVVSCEPTHSQALEYVRLFLHGNGTPTVHPYESVFTHNRLMAPECLDDLRKLHGAAGLRPKKGVPVPPDHLGLELEFLAFVLRGREEARASGSGTDTPWELLAEGMLRRHLVPFARQFRRRLDEAKPSPYYASAADALVQSLHAGALMLGLDVEKAPPGDGR